VAIPTKSVPQQCRRRRAKSLPGRGQGAGQPGVDEQPLQRPRRHFGGHRHHRKAGAATRGPAVTRWSVRRKLPTWGRQPRSGSPGRHEPDLFVRFRVAEEWSVRKPLAVRRSARQMCIGHSVRAHKSTRLRGNVTRLSSDGRIAITRSYRLCTLVEATPYVEQAPKSTTATHEYELHLWSHRPNRSRPPIDAEEVHAGHNSSQNTRMIISRLIHVRPERHAARR
jgi:hypothetical protein